MWDFLQRFEDRDKSTLGPNILFLQSWGVWKRKNIMYYLFIFHTIYFLPSQFIELWIVRKDQELALRNLSYSLLSTTCFVKAATFIIWQDDWKKIIDCVMDLEKGQLSAHDERQILAKYKKYSRVVTYSYCFLAACTVIIVTTAPLILCFSIPVNRERILNGTDPYPEIMSSWVPFEKSGGLGYYATLFLQASIYVWGGGIVGSYDSTAVTLMSFFAGQLEVLKLRCEKMFGDQSDLLTYNVLKERIGRCHQHHEILIKHCSILSSLLSPIMFLYVIICSIMICAAAIRLTTEGISTIHQIWLAEYLIALVSQLFLYCWHSDMVYYSSLSVNYGVFASAWWPYDIRVLRSIQLLNGKLGKTLLFTVGPFTSLQVGTFIAVLKGSYSYYTILK